MRRVGRRLEEIVERAGDDLGVMVDGGEPVIAVHAHTQSLAGGRAMAHRAVHVFTAQHQLDRFADQLRRQDAEQLRSRDEAFRAEAAAEIGAADMNLLG